MNNENNKTKSNKLEITLAIIFFSLFIIAIFSIVYIAVIEELEKEKHTKYLCDQKNGYSPSGKFCLVEEGDGIDYYRAIKFKDSYRLIKNE